MQRFLDLNISRENELQSIVTLAAETCQVPIAVIVSWAEDKPVLKYKAGSMADGITNENSFSYIKLQRNEVTVISDTALHPQCADDTLVTNYPYIRFYAGIPLFTHDDQHIGTLYVMGLTPKELSQRRKGMLKILARQAVNMIEFDMSLRLLKQQFIEAKNSENKLRSFFESSKSSHLLIGCNMEVLTFNKTFYDITYQVLGYSVVAGTDATKYIPPSYLDDFITYVRMTLSGTSVQHERLLKFDGFPPFWARLAYNPAYDSDRKIIGVSFNVTDISKRKRSEQRILEQNEALRKIAHLQSHELRKPVASILGLMNLIKLEGYGSHQQTLQMMERAVLELDSTIHHIVSITESQPVDFQFPEIEFNNDIDNEPL